MDWQPEVGGRLYTLTEDAYQVLMWHASTAEWIVLISSDDQAVNHARYGKLRDAQRWAEQQLAKLQHLERSGR